MLEPEVVLIRFVNKMSFVDGSESNRLLICRSGAELPAAGGQK